MAISYEFEIATTISAPQVADALHDIGHSIGLFDASVTSERIVEEGALSKPGTWIRVIKAWAPPWNPITVDLGFTPTVSVTFRLNKEADISGQLDDMARLVAGLLETIPGDAVLHYQVEIIWLLRRGDDLSLNKRDDLWPPRRLALLSQSYRRATYTFAEE